MTKPDLDRTGADRIAPTDMRRIPLPEQATTSALGAALARLTEPGECLLLSGPIGAGKSHIARAFIHTAYADAGVAPPDVPSPTFTLVQLYSAPGGEIVHADLYRLGDPGELEELGLADSLGRARCVIEWPDRLGPGTPEDALWVDLVHNGPGRIATLSGLSSIWGPRLAALDIGATTG